jgi:hypothetical protein
MASPQELAHVSRSAARTHVVRASATEAVRLAAVSPPARAGRGDRPVAPMRTAALYLT